MTSEFATRASHAPPAERILGRLKAEAQAVISREPDMAGHVMSAVMKHRTLASVVIHRLAARLGHADLSADLIRQKFSRLAAADAGLEDAFVCDLVATVDRDPACLRFLEPILYFKGFHALQTHRFTHALWRQGRDALACYLQSRASSVFQVDIHPSAVLGKGVMLDHATGFVVAADAVVEDDVSILHNVSIGVAENAGPTMIRHGASLGAGSRILENVEIGSGVRVAAGSVVNASVRANQTVAGSPARIVTISEGFEPSRTLDELFETKLKSTI